MYKASLLTVVEKLGLNHLFWSLQMPIPMPLAQKLLEADQKIRSPEDQESELEFSNLQMKQASEGWLFEHFQDYPVLAYAVCKETACEKIPDETQKERLKPLADSGHALFLLEYSRQLSQLQKDWKLISGGEVLTLQQLSTPLQNWPRQYRDLWLKYLVTKAHLFKTESLFGELSIQLGFQNDPSQMQITTCTYQELKTCATSASQEWDSDGKPFTAIQLRLDGHSEIQLLQSLFHEMTHHLQFQHEDLLEIGNSDPGFVMISEGLAMCSALTLPEVLSSRGRDPYTIEAFHYFGLLELYRQSPNQSYAQFWRAVSLLISHESWSKLIPLLIQQINTISIRQISEEIEKRIPTQVPNAFN